MHIEQHTNNKHNTFGHLKLLLDKDGIEVNIQEITITG